MNEDRLEEKLAALEVLFNRKLTEEEKNSIKAFLKGDMKRLKLFEASDRLLGYIIANLIRGQALVFTDNFQQLERELKFIRSKSFKAKVFNPNDDREDFSKFLLALWSSALSVDYQKVRSLLFLGGLQSLDSRIIRMLNLPTIFTNSEHRQNSSYIGIKKVINAITLKSYLKDFCKRQLNKRGSGAVWCKTIKTAEELYKLLQKANIRAFLITKDTKELPPGDCVFIATSSLLYRDVKINWSFCYLWPAGVESLAEIINRTSGPCIIGIEERYKIAMEQGFIKGNCQDFKGWLGSCLKRELRKHFNEEAGPQYCYNCSYCYERFPEKYASARLLEWRERKAKEEALPLSFVITDKQLNDIAQARPKNTRELKAIKGIKSTKAAKYGKEILEVIKPIEEA